MARARALPVGGGSHIIMLPAPWRTMAKAMRRTSGRRRSMGSCRPRTGNSGGFFTVGWKISILARRRRGSMRMLTRWKRPSPWRWRKQLARRTMMRRSFANLRHRTPRGLASCAPGRRPGSRILHARPGRPDCGCLAGRLAPPAAPLSWAGVSGTITHAYPRADGVHAAVAGVLHPARARIKAPRARIAHLRL